MAAKNNDQRILIRIEAYDAVSYLMLLLGSIAIIFSVLCSSYILAFLGLGLAFWGALFLYIRPTRYVKVELLNAVSISALTSIERILADAKTDSRGVYLPPKRLTDVTSSLVFVPMKASQPLPATNESIPKDSVFKNSEGLFITPPGLALSNLFEKQLRKSLIETSLEDLERALPRLFEELQITKNLTIHSENDTIMVELRNHVLRDLCEETARLERTHRTVGCPLSSALACAFAKATGKPIAIEREVTDRGETTSIKFQILGE